MSARMHSTKPRDVRFGSSVTRAQRNAAAVFPIRVRTPPRPVRSSITRAQRNATTACFWSRVRTPPRPVRSSITRAQRNAAAVFLIQVRTPPRPVRSSITRAQRNAAAVFLIRVRTPPRPVRSSVNIAHNAAGRECLLPPTSASRAVRSADGAMPCGADEAEHEFTPLPLRYRAILVKNARHGLGTAEREFRQAGFAQFEAESGPLRERKTPVHHPHGRKAEPLLPDLLFRSGSDTATDLLDEKVRHRRIDVERCQAADRTFTSMRRHGYRGEVRQGRHFPQSANTADMIDVGLQDIDDAEFNQFPATIRRDQAFARRDRSG